MPLPQKKSKIGKFKIAGGHFTPKELKKQFAKSSDGLVIYLKPDEDVNIRFLTEPDEWFSFTEHFMQINGKGQSVPCIGDGCPGEDDEQARTSTKVLVPVWHIEKKKVKLIKANATLARQLLKYHSRDRLLGRDFTLMREGEGTDTKYLLDPEEPSKRKETKDAEIPDLEKVLQGWVSAAYGGGKPKKKDDDDFEDEELEDEDEEETTKKKKAKKSDDDDEDEDEDEKPRKKKKSDEDDDEDEDEDEKPKKKRKSDDDEEDDDEEDEAPKKPKKLKKKDKDDDEDEDDDD